MMFSDMNILFPKESKKRACGRAQLVDCLGFNGPLRQYFSLYRAVSKEREKEKRNDRRENKFPNNPHPHPLQGQ